ncbi:MAG: hypothetical protein GY696_16005 [Gammaproteobacteria bacterium]|nr:hypothetical protein [Gammaproteobacteria bacterium]
MKNQIRPRMKNRIGFALNGQHGIGKTAIMEWCFKHAEGKKAMVSATQPPKEIFKEICLSWDLDVKDGEGESATPSKWLVPWMHKAILAQTDCWLFIDDMHRITPATLQKLKPIRDRCILVCAFVPPIRKEELKRLLWGLKYIEIGPIKNNEMKRIGQRAAPLIASATPVMDAVHAARGIPAHMFHALRGEVTPESAKTKSEEFDISPILLIFLAGIMALRYVARGMDSSALTMISGLGMAGAVIFRFYLFKGMK